LREKEMKDIKKKITKFFRIEINELKKYVIQKVEGR